MKSEVVVVTWEQKREEEQGFTPLVVPLALLNSIHPEELWKEQYRDVTLQRYRELDKTGQYS